MTLRGVWILNDGTDGKGVGVLFSRYVARYLAATSSYINLALTCIANQLSKARPDN